MVKISLDNLKKLSQRIEAVLGEKVRDGFLDIFWEISSRRPDGEFSVGYNTPEGQWFFGLVGFINSQKEIKAV